MLLVLLLALLLLEYLLLLSFLAVLPSEYFEVCSELFALTWLSLEELRSLFCRLGATSRPRLRLQ